jgi:prepilin-type N-terminal cleavage/methylation domain-containing protein
MFRLLMFRSTSAASDRGFTLLETLIALVVLTVGVVATASLATHCMTITNQSKFMSLAAQLASEKLEDLSRWDVDSPQVCVPAGSSSVGSLTSDILQTTTCPPPLSSCTSAGGNWDDVNYYDDVSISTVVAGPNSPCPSTTYGCFSETVSTYVNGSTVYATTVHPPSGQIQRLPSNSTPPTMVTFHRRWIIEANTPVAGVSSICLPGTRRVTVLVTLRGTPLPQETFYAPVTVPVSFQMSMVRP